MNLDPVILVNPPIVVGKGVLLPFDFGKINEIDVKRVFIISDLQGSARGGHAHKNSKQALQVINGNISCHITNVLGKKWEFLMTPDSGMLLIKPRNWLDIVFNEASSVVVLTDTIYSEDDYIRSKDDFFQYESTS